MVPGVVLMDVPVTVDTTRGYQNVVIRLCMCVCVADYPRTNLV